MNHILGSPSSGQCPGQQFHLILHLLCLCVAPWAIPDLGHTDNYNIIHTHLTLYQDINPTLIIGAVYGLIICDSISSGWRKCVWVGGRYEPLCDDLTVTVSRSPPLSPPSQPRYNCLTEPRCVQVCVHSVPGVYNCTCWLSAWLVVSQDICQ